MQIRHKAIIISVLGIIIISALLFRLLKDDQPNSPVVTEKENRGLAGESIDVALDFMEVWQEARISTTTNPYQENLTSIKPLSQAVSEMLKGTETAFRENGFDPVLCQSEVPSGFKVKPIFANEAEAQLIIFPKEEKVGVQTIFTLKSQDSLWEISDITCGTGEQGPELGEFTFEQEGFLLKESVQPPLNSEYWHLVYAQDGVLGYTAPLVLGTESQCLTTGNTAAVCSDSLLAEAMQVTVKGNLTEAGVEVKWIELVR